MKKVLVVLLSLCMVLGCFSFAFADTFTDVKADNKFANAIGVLSDLDILEGDGNGTFRPTDGLKRSEAAVVLVKLIGQGAYAEAQTATKFSDVPASHWASGWIAYAANLGLVEGYGDGKFGPDDNLTYDQWLTMVMRAMGYKDQYLAGDWPTNFIVKANSIDLVDPSLTGAKPMTRAEMAQVAYNSLDKGAVSYSLTITGEANEITGGSTFLAKNKVTKSPAATVVQSGATGAAASHVGELGYTYTKNGNIVAFEPASDALVGTYKVASGKDTFVTEGKTYEFAITPTAAIADAAAVYVENADTTGGVYPLAADEEYVLSVHLDNAGKIDTIYSAEHWTVTKNVQFTKAQADALAKNLAAKNLTGTTVVFNGTYNLPVKDKAVDAAAVKGDLSAVKANSIVTVYAKADGTTVSKIEVSNDVVTGNVTYINNANSTYTIAGKAYKADADGVAAGLVVPTTTSTTEKSWYLTAAGDLFAEVTAPDVETNYAVITLAAGPDGAAGYGESVVNKVKLLTADGKEAVYTLKSSIAIAPLTADKVVSYALDDKGVITTITVETTTALGAGQTYNKTTGIIAGKLISKGALVVVKDGTTPKWRVAKIAEIPATLTAAVVGKLNSASTSYDVLVLDGAALATETAKTIGVWQTTAVNDKLEGKTNYKVGIALVNGKEVEMKKTAAFTISDNTKLYSFTVTDGLYDSESALTADVTGTVVTAVEDGKIYLNDSKFYAIGTSAQVYVWDATKTTWSVGTVADAAVGKTVELYDTNTAKDSVIDVILVK